MEHDVIERMLREAEREWVEGSEKQAYFQSRLAMAHALLNISKLLYEVTTEYNQICVKVGRDDDY